MSRLAIVILYAFSFLLGRKQYLVAFFLPRFFATFPVSSPTSSSYQLYFRTLQRHGSSSSAAANVEDFGVASRAAQSQIATQVQDGSIRGSVSSGNNKQYQQPWRKSTERRDTKFKSSNSKSKGFEEKTRQVDKVLAACRAMVAAANDAGANATLTSKLAVTEVSTHIPKKKEAHTHTCTHSAHAPRSRQTQTPTQTKKNYIVKNNRQITR